MSQIASLHGSGEKPMEQMGDLELITIDFPKWKMVIDGDWWWLSIAHFEFFLVVGFVIRLTDNMGH